MDPRQKAAFLATQRVEALRVLGITSNHLQIKELTLLATKKYKFITWPRLWVSGDRCEDGNGARFGVLDQDFWQRSTTLRLDRKRVARNHKNIDFSDFIFIFVSKYMEGTALENAFGDPKHSANSFLVARYNDNLQK